MVAQMSHSPVGNSPFLKRVLVPFWVVRIFIMVIEIAIYGYAVGIIASNKDGYRHKYIRSLAFLAVVEVILVLCLLLDVICIIKRARRTLSPRFFFATNLIQTVVFVVLFVLSIFSAMTILNLVLNIVVVLSFIGLLVYASIIFHKDRNGTLRGSYTTAGDFPESTKLVTRTDYNFANSKVAGDSKSTYMASAYEPDRQRLYYDTPTKSRPEAVLPTDRQTVQSFV